MDAPPPNTPARDNANGRPFLGVQFIKCRAYGRLYLNDESATYLGRCPRCGAPVRVPIGEEGTNQRFFVAVCP